MTPQKSQIFFVIFSLLSFSTFAQTTPIACTPEDQADNCPNTEDPVCLERPIQCFANPCLQSIDMSNRCQACSGAADPSTVFYTPGKCQYKCEPTNLPSPDIIGLAEDPVCGIFQENCQDASCRKTFANSTQACQDSTLISFSLGVCPDDPAQNPTAGQALPSSSNEIVCTPEDQADSCPDTGDPVCVPMSLQCFANPCYQSFNVPNKCQACSGVDDPSTVSYTPGKCQYRCEPINLPSPGIIGLAEDPVCGIYRENCQDASCRQTFANSTEACQDSTLLSFSLGACADDEEYLMEEEYSMEEGCVFEDEWFEDF